MAQKNMLLGECFSREGTPDNPPPEMDGKITSMLAHAAAWLDLNPSWTEGNIDWYYLPDVLDAIITKIHQLQP